ncbi:MAG: hypothetical protein JNL49_14425 [Bacteroidia bacterium]|nr:hypothetical protein [Bacteroidia bacterium]
MISLIKPTLEGYIGMKILNFLEKKISKREDMDWTAQQDHAIKNIFPLIFPGSGEFISYSAGPASDSDPFPMSLDESTLRFSGWKKPANNYIIHFTSTQNAFKILHEKRIRLYNFFKQEDPLEFDYYLSGFKHYIKDYSDYRERQFILCGVDPQIIGSPFEIHAWRAFGDRGNGCALQFELIENPSADYRFAAIQYEQPDYDAINRAFENFQKTFGVPFEPTKLLSLAAGLYKHPAYSIEQEKRIILNRRYHRGTNIPNDPFNIGEIHTEIHSGERHPYINLSIDPLFNPINLPKLKLRKLFFGPRVSDENLRFWNDELQLFYLRSLSESYNEIEIVKSSITWKR